MKKLISYLFLLLSFNSLLYASSEPTFLIVVRGTANCGKSTLCKKLNSLLNNAYTIVSQDDECRKVCYKAFKTLFPIDMAIVSQAIAYENRWQALKYGNIIFPKDIDKQQEESIASAVGRMREHFDNPQHNKQLAAVKVLGKQKTMHQLTFYAAQRRNVIFDSWGVTNWDGELNELKKYFSRLTIVATHCSLQTIKQRWEHRNYSAIQTNNYAEMRLMCQMLNSFFGFLRPQGSEDKHEGHTIITKKDFDEIIQEAQKYTIIGPVKQQESFVGREFTMEELLNFKTKMYAKFNFDDTEKVAIVPSVAHDILLCTEGDCDAYATELLQKISLSF